MEVTNSKITPALAEEWLALRYKGQRILKDRQIRKIATAILRNEWRENGATIVFNKQGALIDGQHRLRAIMKAGRTVRSLVVDGVSSTEATFQSIDDSLARAPSDFLQCKHRHNVAAAGKILWHVVNDDFPGQNLKPPVPDLLKVVAPWVDIISNSVARFRLAGRLTGQGSFISFLALYYAHIVQIAAEGVVDGFFDRVGDGVDLAVGNPALALRNRFSIMTNERISVVPARALVLKALHAHLDGKTVRKLSFNSVTEAFPELRLGHGTI